MNKFLSIRVAMLDACWATIRPFFPVKTRAAHDAVSARIFTYAVIEALYPISAIEQAQSIQLPAGNWVCKNHNIFGS